MASIKERLAALNLAEKLYVRPPAVGVMCRNYQSFSSWSGLIADLKASVKVKRRRVHIKSHDDCFLGSDAVDVVADHLSHALLDCKVFEAVGTKVFGKDKNQEMFHDCKNTLYRFLTHTPSVDELERGVLINGIPKFFCSHAKHLEMLSKSDEQSLSPSRLQTDTVLPHALVTEVWREQTTVRLLKLVDLPLLDGVLQCGLDPGSHSYLRQCKVQVYGILVKHYSHTDRHQLLPQHLTDVYTAIIDLLVKAKLDQALEALQLCLKLLPPSCREELRRLLSFMALAADPQGVRLDKEMENRLAVKRSFSRAIIHSRTLSKEQEELMVVFMLSNRQEIFRIPATLHKAVSDKLANIVHGNPPDVTGSTFCQQVPRSTAQSKEGTKQELRALLSNIHLDPKISDKRKKSLLRQFYQSHPEVFDQYFGDSALSML
ncbi:hypothetical protein NHX12_003299 [Muraenolepis orangiensis]|uniref:DEP domain-containing protein 7 n=1 Tax=Muraenolepis orangiensis TaxID=630683 RepID=A0A9Q0DW86_9TELE|nr:hypothetical protein NHX12_003299 [Muraenolepis orangiensis]